MLKKIKKVTLDGLSDKIDKLGATMQAGFQRVDVKMEAGFKQAEENRESLARMIAGGFEDVMGTMAAKDDLKTLATKDDLATLERGYEDIQLRLDSVAPKFEVKDLERRVKRLEDRTGIRHTIQR